jgi:hypothetical protein
VDDTSLGTNSITNNESDTVSSAESAKHEVLINNLCLLAQKWEKLLFSMGRALNLSKCFWFLLAWKWEQGKAKLHSATTAPGKLEMTSEGDLDTTTTIKHIQVTDSYRTSGVFISPSGSNAGAITILNDIAQTYCLLLAGSTLTHQESLTGYLQYFLPKIWYQPPLLSLCKCECDKIMSPVYMALLPKLHVNRNTSRAIIHGPELYGGLSLPNLHVVQVIDWSFATSGQDRTGQDRIGQDRTG